jgi:hypothetical protein
MTEHCTRRVWEYRDVMAQRLQELPPQGTMALAGRCDASGGVMVLETGGYLAGEFTALARASNARIVGNSFAASCGSPQLESLTPTTFAPGFM